LSAREERKQSAETLGTDVHRHDDGGSAGAVSAQVSLATVVDLAQRNSSAVKLAQADVQKARRRWPRPRMFTFPA
jgi:hypothetical protein